MKNIYCDERGKENSLGSMIIEVPILEIMVNALNFDAVSSNVPHLIVIEALHG